MKSVLKAILPQSILNRIRDARRKRRMQELRGDNVYCVICDHSFSKFLPFGLHARDNARCPNCGSLERHRLQYKYLRETTNLFDGKPKRLLHFAPEKFFLKMFSRVANLEYVPCDLFPELYDQQGNTPVVKVDITQIPFEGNYFDVILCNHVLEHIPDDRLAMSELFRVMKADGWGVFQVPLDYTRDTTYEDFTITEPKDREREFGQHNHVRWYGRDYMTRLNSVGFVVKEDNYVTRLPSEEVRRNGLSANELIYYCRKSV